MDRLAERWQAAVDAAAPALAAHGLSAPDVAAVQQLLREMHFPGQLALLASGSSAGNGPVGTPLIEAAAALAEKQPTLARNGVEAATLSRLLRAILVERRPPGDLLADEGLQAVVLEVAARHLAAHGVGVSPDQARTALSLLT